MPLIDTLPDHHPEIDADGGHAASLLISITMGSVFFAVASFASAFVAPSQSII